MRLFGSMMYRSPWNVVSWPYASSSLYHARLCCRVAVPVSAAEKYRQTAGSQRCSIKHTESVTASVASI